MINQELLKKRYDKYGTIMFDLDNSFFNNEDFLKVEKIINQLPYEFVSVGDA